MSDSQDRSVFSARCARVGIAAARAGATLTKAPGDAPALVIERRGRSITFPIVTDDRAWAATGVDEALYAVLVDARGWAAATTSDVTLATLDDAKEPDAPAIRRDISAERERVDRLADLLGGPAELDALYAAAEI